MGLYWGGLIFGRLATQKSGGLIFGGAYIWGGLLSEVYGTLVPCFRLIVLKILQKQKVMVCLFFQTSVLCECVGI